VSAADVVVIGGGIVGTAATLFLQRRGLSVILLERGLIGQQASGVSFANVRRHTRPLHQLPLAQRSYDSWMRLSSLIGDTCEFRQVGNLAVTYGNAQLEHWEQYVRAARDYGLELEILDPLRLRTRFPYLSKNIAAGLFSPKDGHANPRLLVPAISRAAEREGARIVLNAEVTSIDRNADRFDVAVGGHAEYRAPIVLIAAGAWAGKFVAALDGPVPLFASGPQLGVTEPLPYRIGPTISVFADRVPERIYLRQVERGNIVFGGGDRGPASTETNRASVLPTNTLGQITQLQRLVPALSTANVIRVWSGIEGYLPDALPVMGASSRVRGLYYAFGFSGSGFQLGLGVGDVLSELICTGHTDVPLCQYDIRRFQPATPKSAPGSTRPS